MCRDSVAVGADAEMLPDPVSADLDGGGAGDLNGVRTDRVRGRSRRRCPLPYDPAAFVPD